MIQPIHGTTGSELPVQAIRSTTPEKKSQSFFEDPQFKRAHEAVAAMITNVRIDTTK
jgi:hypothetical protein